MGVQIDAISSEAESSRSRLTRRKDARFKSIVTSLLLGVFINFFGTVFGVDFRTFSAVGVLLLMAMGYLLEMKKKTGKNP